jgi:hypothetical protein
MWKCFGSTATVAVAFVASVLSSAPLYCQAQLISSFENNLSSSVGATWEGPGIPNSEFVSTGATDGTSALAIHHSPGWNIQAILRGGLPLAQAAATHDFLVLDVTTTDLGIAGDGWSPAWRQMIVVFNSNQGGWQQSDINYPVAADDGGSLTSTVVLDLVASGVKANAQAYVNSGGGGNTYWELFLPMQGGDQGTPVKAGDYGSDSLVNASDYVTWRKSLGGTTLANETVTPGSVDAADYTEWRAHFGKDYSQITTIIDNVRFASAGSGAGGLAATGVPEPSSAALILAAVLALASRRRVCI